MGKEWYIGDDNTKARKVKNIYIGDENGKARKVKKVYIGDEIGKARSCWSGGKKTMVCFDNSKAAYSIDLQAWIVIEGDTGKYYSYGTFGNDKFIRVSVYSTSYSSNGITWGSSDFKADVSALEFIDGKFIIYRRFMTNGNGIFLSSKDGVTWGNNDCTLQANITLNVLPKRIIKVNSTYVMIAYNSQTDSSQGIIFASTDGTTWVSKAYRAYRYCEDIAYGNGKIVVVGGTSNQYGGCVWYSSDLESWTIKDSGYTFYSVCFGNGVFVASADTGLLYSTDGITWSLALNLYNNTTIKKVIFTGEKFYCAGIWGYSYYSTDGITWTQMNGLSKDFRNGNVIYSIDGGGSQY